MHGFIIGLYSMSLRYFLIAFVKQLRIQAEKYLYSRFYALCDMYSVSLLIVGLQRTDYSQLVPQDAMIIPMEACLVTFSDSGDEGEDAEEEEREE